MSADSLISTKYSANNFLPDTFSLNIPLDSSQYSIEIWKRIKNVSQDKLRGTYIITTTKDTNTWSGNGNNGIYILTYNKQPGLDVHFGNEKTHDFYKDILNRRQL